MINPFFAQVLFGRGICNSFPTVKKLGFQIILMLDVLENVKVLRFTESFRKFRARMILEKFLREYTFFDTPLYCHFQ
jgi:hypothetical protein